MQNDVKEQEGSTATAVAVNSERLGSLAAEYAVFAAADSPEEDTVRVELLTGFLDPPELNDARRWLTAAEADHTGAQTNLGHLLATRLDPPRAGRSPPGRASSPAH